MPSLAQNNTSSPSINTVVHDGEYEIAPIRSPLDNKILFEVTTPNALYRKKVSMGASHAEVRAKGLNTLGHKEINASRQNDLCLISENFLSKLTG